MESIATLPVGGLKVVPALRPGLMTARQVAEHLNVSPGTLANWRCAGSGPAYVKVGDAVRYRPEALEAWIQSATVAA